MRSYSTSLFQVHLAMLVRPFGLYTSKDVLRLFVLGPFFICFQRCLKIVCARPFFICFQRCLKIVLLSNSLTFSVRDKGYSHNHVIYEIALCIQKRSIRLYTQKTGELLKENKEIFLTCHFSR